MRSAISNVLAKLGIHSPADVSFLIYLFIALGLWIALHIVRRRVTTPKSADTANRHLASRIDDIDYRFEDYKGRTAKTLTVLEQDLKSLRHDVARLNDVLKEVGRSLRADQEDTEKKTEFSGIESVPRPEAPTRVEAEPATSDIAGGLTKTRTHFFSRLRGILTGRRSVDGELLENLEELLIGSDLGVGTSKKLLERLKESAATSGELDEASVTASLKRDIAQILGNKTLAQIVPAKEGGRPKIVVVVGVNGVGKTTTIAKLASQFKNEGAKVLLAAADTFRAAAVEQLNEWATRIGVDLVSAEEGAKPSTVVYQALHRANNENYDILLVDTAGRLHTKVNLMNELENVIKIINREQLGAPHEVILVVDASTGQNALLQAREFNERASLTGIVVTKLDGTPKGGIVVAIKDDLGVPIRYIGVGEGVKDLRLFDAEEFVEGLFSSSDSTNGTADGLTARAQVRRKKRMLLDDEAKL